MRPVSAHALRNEALQGPSRREPDLAGSVGELSRGNRHSTITLDGLVPGERLVDLMDLVGHGGPAVAPNETSGLLVGGCACEELQGREARGFVAVQAKGDDQRQ